MAFLLRPSYARTVAINSGVCGVIHNSPVAMRFQSMWRNLLRVAQVKLLPSTYNKAWILASDFIGLSPFRSTTLPLCTKFQVEHTISTPYPSCLHRGWWVCYVLIRVFPSYCSNNACPTCYCTIIRAPEVTVNVTVFLHQNADHWTHKPHKIMVT